MATHYVSPTGTATWSASTNISTPCSITTMLSNIADGDLAYLREGTYHQECYIEHGTIAGYPGETAIIDGQEDIPGTWAALVNLHGNNVIVRDLTVQNSLWIGVNLGGDDCQVINVYSNNNYEQGILAQGVRGIIDGCRVYYNCKSNEFGSQSRTYWATACCAGGGSTYTTIKNCTIWNNWGEALCAGGSRYTTAQDNVVYDNWRGSYIVDSWDCIYQRNLFYTTPDNPCEGYPEGQQWGLTLGDEGGGSYTPSARNTVINNLIYGCADNLQIWGSTGVTDDIIANNTFVKGQTNACVFLGNSTGTGAIFKNNIVIQEDSLPVAAGGGYSNITFSYNNWSKTAPVGVQGTGDQTGDPLLAKTGPTTPGSFNPGYFKITSSSPARDHGNTVSAVTVDYWGTSRPKGSSPDIGAHEWTSEVMYSVGLRFVQG